MFAIPPGTWTGGTWTESGDTTASGSSAIDHIYTDGTSHGAAFPEHVSTGTFSGLTTAVTADQLADINAAAGTTLTATFNYNGSIGFGESISSFTLTLTGTAAIAPYPNYGTTSWTLGAQPTVRCRTSGWKNAYAAAVPRLCILGMIGTVTNQGNANLPAAVSVLLDTGAPTAQTDLYFTMAYLNVPSATLRMSNDLENWTTVPVASWEVWNSSAWSAITAAQNSAGAWTWAGNAGTYTYADGTIHGAGVMHAILSGAPTARYWQLIAQDSAAVGSTIDVQWFAGGIPTIELSPLFYNRPASSRLARNPTLLPGEMMSGS
jgi:hypothetical protein